MVIIPKDNWQKTNYPEYPNFPLKAEFTCPGCGIRIGVGKVHSISSDGTLSPSMVCPHKPCEFHKYIQFEGWSD